jgi:tetratricopeptide (TPR) repeat protein
VLDVMVLGRSWKRAAMWLWPWAIFAAGAGVVAAMIQPAQGSPENVWYLRPLIAADALAFYLGKLVFPVGMNFDYGRTPAMVLSDPALPLYWIWAFPAAVAGVIAWLKRPMLSAGAWVFMLGVLPVLGLTPFIYQTYSTVADRYVYVSMLGAGTAAAWALGRMSPRSAAFIAAVVLVILGSLSVAQAGRWKDTRLLFEYSEQINPNRFNPLHLDSLGRYYDRLSGGRADENLNRAIACYQRSIQLDPLYPHVYDVLCDELIRAGRFDEAIDVGKSLMEVQPRLTDQQREKPEVLEYRLGMLYFRAGRYSEAEEEFRESISTGPTPDAGKMLKISQDRIAATQSSTRG